MKEMENRYRRYEKARPMAGLPELADAGNRRRKVYFEISA